MKMPLVKVSWKDAQLLADLASGRFEDPNVFAGAEPAVVELAGWLVERARTRVVVASEHCPETGEVKIVHVIPSKSIVSLKFLKEEGGKK